jgi:hypothetical protein
MNRPRLRLTAAALTAAVALGLPALVDAAEAAPTTPDGVPVVWSEWVRANGPAAVLIWASWVPEADDALADLDRIAFAARARELEFVVVVVQEPIDEAREAIGGVDVLWFHDRYGGILKEYRVVSIPILLVLSEDGKVTERVPVTRESLRAWSGG